MNKKNNLKKFLIVIVCILFSLFISFSFIFYDRNYLLIESLFKNTFFKINEKVIKNVYKTNYLNENVINEKISYYKKQNDKLKELLDIKIINEDYKSAVVVNRKEMNILNKVEIYSKNNVKLNSPVIESEGLVGFISKTNKNVSEVSLLKTVNKDNSVFVNINTTNSNISGILNKYDKKTNRFIVSDIIKKDEIKKGDTVTLSNSLNDGVLIGYVDEIKKKDYGLTKSVYVKSNVDFNNILYLLVIDNNDK